MSRVKTFNATGVAPNGRLYSGDLNLIQDQYSDLSNFAQTHDVGTLRVGDSSLSLLKYGTGEMRLTGKVRIDSILRGLGGIYAGAFTTAGRDSLAQENRPYGLMITNTTKNRLEWNSGSDVTPVWRSPLFGAESVDLPAGLISAAGTLAARPSPSAVAAGSFYFATDQDVLFQQIGGAWFRRNPSTHILSPCLFSAAPTGWRIMDGSQVTAGGINDDLRNALIAAGNPHGSGGGNPLLPDTRGRGIVGLDGAQTEFDTLGEKSGAKTHTLTGPESGIAAHGHTVNAHSHTVNSHSHTVNSHSHAGVTGWADRDHSHAFGVGLGGDGGGTDWFVAPGWGEPYPVQVRRIYGTGGQSENHVHAVNAEAPGTSSASPGTSDASPPTNNAGPTSAAQAHNNLQPYIVLPWMVHL